MKNLFALFIVLISACSTIPTPSSQTAMDAQKFTNTLGIAGGFTAQNVGLTLAGGFKTIRADFPGNAASLALVKQLVDAGVSIIWEVPNIGGPVTGQTLAQQMTAWQTQIASTLNSKLSDGRKLSSVIESVEGLNERDFTNCDGYPGYNPPCAGWQAQFVASTVALKQELATLGVTVPVLGGSLFMDTSPAAIALSPGASAIPSDINFANVHLYDGTYSMSDMVNAYQTLAPGLPTRITEWGFTGTSTPSDQAFAVDALAALAQAQGMGIDKFLLYTMVADSGSHLASSAGVTTTAYTILSNIEGALKAPATLPLKSLDYSSNASTALYQSGSQLFILAWNTGSSAITVKFGTAPTGISYYDQNSKAAVAIASSNSISFSMTSNPVLIQVSP